MGIYKKSNIKINIILEIILCKILFILGKDNIANKNTIIIEVKQKLIDKSFEDEEIKNENYYNLIVNKLVPNNLYLEFKINSEKAQIPGYLTFTAQYNYYGLDTCIKLENDNIFNITSTSTLQSLPSFQLYNNEYQKYYYIKENISISDSENYAIDMNDIDIIIPENNEKQAKCLIVGLNPIRDLQKNMGIKNLPLVIKSNKKIKNNFQVYLTILYKINEIFMLIGEPPHLLYPNLYHIKSYKEIENYNLKNEFSTYYMKNLNAWTIKLDQIFIGNDSYTSGEKFIGQFSLDYIPFIVPMDFFRKYLSYGLDYYISKNICSQKGRPLTSKFAHSIINDKKQTYIFISCQKDKIENLTEFYERMPEFSFKNKELNKTFKFEGKNLFAEVGNFLVLMIMPDLFNKIIVTFGKMFMEKYLFTFNYDRNTIGFYDESIKIKNLNKNISENKIPIEVVFFFIFVLFLVIILFMFKFLKGKKLKGKLNLDDKDNQDDLIEKELIDINKENENS